jgi:hypothetical protein
MSEQLSLESTGRPSLTHPVPPSGDEWKELLSKMPHRAVVAFALRWAKRVEPFNYRNELGAEAFCVGITIPSTTPGKYEFAAEVRRYACLAARAFYASSAIDNAQRAYETASHIDPARPFDFEATRDSDLSKFLELNLGKPGEPGQPIRWNDPRLGPLWPQGEPEWYTQAVRACRELEEKLRSLPDPNAPLLPWYIVAQMEDRAWLDQLQTEGKLEVYRGEFVIAAEKVIYAHGRSLLKAREKAEQKAQKQGVPTERLTDYFVPDEI